MLRACNRVLRRGGKIGFLVISAAPDLDPAQRQRALEVGHVDPGPGYPALLAQAGFVDTEVHDVTDQYRTTLAAWLGAYDDESEALTDLIGAEELSERQARRTRNLATVDLGLVHRYLVTAARP